MLSLRQSIERRLVHLAQLSTSPAAIPVELEMCRRSVHRLFNDWFWTYDPRLAHGGRPAHVPLDLFPRQVELINFLEARVAAREDGLVEKSRDIGFTWIAGGFALHRWRFVPGFKTTFGSRKGDYVDRIGDPDSIFEKIRMLLRAMPWWMFPQGFDWKVHDNYMRLVNPENGNVIRGEAGDDMGRGGRSTLYVIDEAAHVEHADRVDAATSANTDVRIWASSVNGMGNTFARKRHGGSLRPDQIFRFHWTDDPRKTAEWAVQKKAELEDHVWAAEYDIDYSASVEGICIPGRWVESSLRLAALLGDRLVPDQYGIGGLDVGAGGKAKSVFLARFGPVVTLPKAWGNPDTTETAIAALDYAAELRLPRPDGRVATCRSLHYDSVGVGVGVASTLNHHSRSGLSVAGINMGDEPGDTIWPDGETSVEKFSNLKADCWWLLRSRFKAAHELMLHLTGQPGGQDHPVSDVIVLPALTSGPDAQILAAQVSLPRWFRNEKGKIMIEKKEQLRDRGIPSPDHAEALTLTFARGSELDTWAALGAKGKGRRR